MRFADYPLWARLAAWALLLALLLSVVLPFVWMVSTSLKSLEEYAVDPPASPATPSSATCARPGTSATSCASTPTRSWSRPCRCSSSSAARSRGGSWTGR